jgi:hypothetical protein
MGRAITEISIAAAVAVGALTTSSAAHAASDCQFIRTSVAWTLVADCTTDQSIVVPVAAFSGGGHTITAVDPPGDHWQGAVLQNGTGTFRVTDVRVTASGLSDVCDVGDSRLSGVRLEGASGSVTRTTVADLRQGDSGCQEGSAIDVRNLAPNAAVVRVSLADNVVTGYQKTGILVNGAIDATVIGNLVDAGAASPFNARNGVQIGFGAQAVVARNRISGNSYSGTGDTFGTGVLVFGGPAFDSPFTVDVQVVNNVIVGADVGVALDNEEADGTAAAERTNNAVIGNSIAHGEVTNAIPYSAGVLDIGNGDRIVGNRIVGAAYDPRTIPGATFRIDVRDAIDPIVRGNVGADTRAGDADDDGRGHPGTSAGDRARRGRCHPAGR